MRAETPIRVVVDCDPGIDDAIALLLALASPELRIVAVTSVAGNVTLERATENALRVLELAGHASIPVAAGEDRPRLRPPDPLAGGRHGRDGLGGAEIPQPSHRPVDEHAVDLIARAADAGPVALAAIGPLTNIALLLDRHPGVAAQIPRVVVMGGGRFTGNATTVAEFNAATDPEAADRVFSSGLAVTIVPLDVTRRALLHPDRFDAIRQTGPIGAFVAAMLDEYAGGADDAPRPVAIHDALALAELIDPGVLETSSARVTVDCSGARSRGQTRFELLPGRGPAGAVQLATDVDAPRFLDLLLSRLARLDAGAGRP